MKKIIIVLITACFFLTGCNSEKEEEKVEEKLLGIDYNVEGNEEALDYDTENPVVALYIKDYGSVVIELYPDIAPNTVNNFISLVKSGFYDDNTFHRLMEGFVLQGGDPDGTGAGGPGYSIKGEFTNNGFENNLSHKKGIVSMARNNISMDSAGSQFFILLGDATYLDKDYATFGKVIAGMDTVEKIEKAEEIEDTISGKLRKNLTLKKAIVDTKGKTYKEVEKTNE